MATKRQQIIDIYDAKFKAITIANGYSSDLGNNVFEFREAPIADEELPALSYGDTSDDIGDEEVGNHNLDIDVEISAAGSSSPAAMREMIQDALKAFKTTKDDSVLKALIVGAAYLGSDMFIEHEKKKYMKARIKFGILYQTDDWEI